MHFISTPEEHNPKHVFKNRMWFVGLPSPDDNHRWWDVWKPLSISPLTCEATKNVSSRSDRHKVSTSETVSENCVKSS